MRVDATTELVIAVDVAKRLRISPQRVNVLAASAGFPKPLGRLGRSTVWRWSSIERWAWDTGRLPTRAERTAQLQVQRGKRMRAAGNDPQRFPRPKLRG